ncbi:Uncharacterised protein [Vibrio cholerae]|nr:Uncharacterised protein [Vibrio cholerae]CSI94113.1 Uncharacterised protein [Vibrio cholerae]
MASTAATRRSRFRPVTTSRNKSDNELNLNLVTSGLRRLRTKYCLLSPSTIPH